MLGRCGSLVPRGSDITRAKDRREHRSIQICIKSMISIKMAIDKNVTM